MPELLAPPIADNLLSLTADGMCLIASREQATGRIFFPARAEEAGRFERILLPREGRLWSWTVQRFRPKSPPYAGTEAFEPYGGGAIINIASVGAFISYQPDAGQVVPYTTSKAAIVHLTSDLAAQWAGHGIRVNAIAPGSIETGMTETLDAATQEKTRAGILLRRFGRPEEVAGTLALLASDAGSFITGQTFLVDGGQSIA